MAMDMDEVPAGSLVLLRICSGVVEANLLRSVLEAHEIPCVIQGENHRSLLGVMGAYIDLRLLVPSELLDEAARLLDDFEEKPPPPPRPEEPPLHLPAAYRDPYPPPAPAGATGLRWKPIHSILGVLAVLLVLALAIATAADRH
jgi:hypothetical protein